MDKLPNLPVGRQYFASVRKDNAVYVDKTEFIYNICSPADSSYFLSRPRRFGKSLTLDTIHELFSGNRALFKGLWIEDKWDWTDTYPVIRMSFDAIGHEGGLSEALLVALQEIADDFDLSLVAKSPGVGFKSYISNPSLILFNFLSLREKAYDIRNEEFRSFRHREWSVPRNRFSWFNR